MTILTPIQIRNTREELRENYRRLNAGEAEVLRDLEISAEELHAVLSMDHPNPSHVWMVRDYLEDRLRGKGVEMYPFSRLADHSVNRWYAYDTPWRKHAQR